VFLALAASLVSAKLLPMKLYAFLMVIFLIFVSLFSVGIPHYFSRVTLDGEASTIFLENFVPLSFPFYSYVNHELHIAVRSETYRLSFLSLILHSSLEYSRSPTPLFASQMNWGINAFYSSFYLIINQMDVIFGYLLSKTKYVERL